MNPLQVLRSYLQQLERRLRALALMRGAAMTAAAALLATLLLVLAANRFAFSETSVLIARVALYFALALAIGAAVLVPVLRVNRRSAARAAEKYCPQFAQRLITFAERDSAPDPFLELLAGDTVYLSTVAEPAGIAANWRFAAYTALGAAACATLVWLAASGPGFLGYGASLLWAGVPKGGAQPFYEIVVEPGDRAIRKNSDQRITARLVGIETSKVRLFARYQSATRWEQTEMRPQMDAPGFEFLLTGIPEPVDYYVEAGGIRSHSYRITVLDLPSIRGLRVTYRFPAWTGMKDVTEDPGGDLRAVEGSTADVEIRTDRPLTKGALVVDDGSKIPLLSSDRNRYQARVPIEKDGMYHVASVEQGEMVRLSEDYFIEARKDAPPTVRITRPGRDAKVNPIEEVSVAVDAQDDFGLTAVDLHYSVNGGAEKTVPLPGKGSREGGGATTLFLEDFKLSPGDVVSLYATARDARASSRTDIFFVEAQPFEREYSQSQVAGGQGGGAGEDENRISQRQKEIIAATWNELKGMSRGSTEAAENARFLSEMQSKLEAQARSLARRMRSRQLAGAGESFNAFVREMEEAAAAMGPAAQQLKSSRWKDALGPEQQALQHLLRAEATFRQIQVAFGSRGGGGGGGGNMGRDLESLFDLELDTEKNQYESGQQSASADNRQKEIDEALAKLEQLARRQQELADRQRSQPQTPQQRWQQEMLRREVEQLRRQMDQLARSGSGGQLDRALNQLSQATRDMQGGGGQEARRAAGRLREARDQLSGMRKQQATGELDSLAQKAGQLARQQQDLANRLRKQYASPATAPNRQGAEQLSQEQQGLLSELESLERQMQNAVRNLSGAQRDAAGKVRKALGDMQQEEPAARMRWMAEAIRRGYGSYVVPRSAPVTNALNTLSEQLREAQRALDRSQPGQGGSEQALSRVESLRRQLEQMSGAGRQSSGREGGREGGQSGERRAGERQGGGDWTAGNPAINRGDWQPAPGGAGSERAYREAVRELAQLRRALAESPEMARDVDDLVRRMQQLDPSRFPGNPQLLERMRSEVLPGLERLELQLRRQVEDHQGAAVRAGSSEPVPPGYADAVAEYFRKLSKDSGAK
jgi:hypothetical protein